MPGGVNSPVRAFKGVGGTPVFLVSGKGSRVQDLDGNRYIDYVGSWGPLILGHAHEEVLREIKESLLQGTSFGAVTPREVELASLIREAFPSMELVRLVNSGTEATMTAIRLARAWTGRDTILKFEGCYHGHSDSFLAKAGSGLLTLGIPSSPGVPEVTVSKTLTIPFNDQDLLRETLEKNKKEIAGVIVEPVPANMGVVPPEDGFLPLLRDLTRSIGALLIFDEVITGFRIALGGAQELFGIVPDLTCLGKIIGGGLPVGAVGGRKEIMELLAPVGAVYQAGTLSGNPLSCAAGAATLEILKRLRPYPLLEQKGKILEEGFTSAAEQNGIDGVLQRRGSMMTFFFSKAKVSSFKDVSASRSSLYPKLFTALLDRGVYFPPSPFEALFVSLAHTDEDLRETRVALDEAMRMVASEVRR